MGLLIVDSPGAGVHLCGGASNNVIGGDPSIGAGPYGQGNYISNSTGEGPGIDICDEGSLGNQILGNIIGALDERGGIWGNGTGVYVSHGASHNTIGPENVIVYNREEGIQIYGIDSSGNTITRNRLFGNGCHILLNDHGNESLVAPFLDRFDESTSTLEGTSCPGCAIEFFSGDGLSGEVFEGAVAADSLGHFAFRVADPSLLPRIVATATDPVGNTSAFPTPVDAEIVIEAARCVGEPLYSNPRVWTQIGWLGAEVYRTTDSEANSTTFWYTLCNVDCACIGTFALARDGLDANFLWASPGWVANTEPEWWIWDSPPDGCIDPGGTVSGAVTVTGETDLAQIVTHVWEPEEQGGASTNILRLPGPTSPPPVIPVTTIEQDGPCDGRLLCSGTDVIVTPIGDLRVQACQTTDPSTGLVTYRYTITNLTVLAIERFAVSCADIEAVRFGAPQGWTANAEVSWWIWSGPSLGLEEAMNTASFSVTIEPGGGSDWIIGYIWLPEGVGGKERHARLELPGPVP